ncbi:clavesin-1 [Halyomorpha halys]|uniref:clavesin-1 n=1 Tax=Halyomorpha halys TaxID=286706 RepID=UPI0006D4F2EF|nr:clavesin-1-like [Halyomorpha halys]
MVIVEAQHEADVIAQVRKLLEGETKLVCPRSDEFLIRFIKASKYDVKDTFILIKDYYRAKLELPNEFVYKNPSSYLDIVGDLEFGFILPQEDSFGRKTLFLRLGNLDPGELDWDRCVQAVILVLEYLSYQPDTQNNGITLVVDCTDLTIRIMKWATPHKLKTMVKILQECIPVRFEVLHIANHPIVFNLFYAALRPFLRDSFTEKFKWHKAPYTDLHDCIKKENIPSWLGGTLDLDSVKDWYDDILKEETLLKENPSMGYGKLK